MSFAQTSSSALINQALDSQVTELNVQGGLLDFMKAIESQTGVRVEAAPSVWDSLPWGQDTSVTVHVKNTTVAAALSAVTRRLGLTYRLGEEAVVLEPAPALARLGRRATLDEIHVLDLMADTPAALKTTDISIGDHLNAMDARLADQKSSFAIQNRAFSSDKLAKVIHIARNASLLDAMEEITNQTDGTWYPWGHSLVVTPKIQATRVLLAKRLSRQYDNVELSQVLADLAEYSGVLFAYAPGSLQQVPAKYSRVTLTLDDATVQQTLEILSGATGLKFTATADGVSVTYDVEPAARPGE